MEPYLQGSPRNVVFSFLALASSEEFRIRMDEWFLARKEKARGKGEVEKEK